MSNGIGQALVDKLESPAGSTSAKSSARPASSKPAGKVAAKASEQAEAVPAADAPVPADLIVAARLSLSEVTSSTAPCSAYYIEALPAYWCNYICWSFMSALVAY